MIEIIYGGVIMGSKVEESEKEFFRRQNLKRLQRQELVHDIAKEVLKLLKEKREV